MIRRSATVTAAVAVIALGGLAGCSSSSSDSATTSASPTATESSMAPVTEPVVLDYGDASATVAVGQAIDFNVNSEMEVDAPSVDEWTIKSDDPKIVSVTPGSSGAAVINPGGMGVAPGETEVKLSVPGKIWIVRVTVTG